MNFINKFYKKLRFPFKLVLASVMYLFIFRKVKSVKVLTIDETLDYLIENPNLSIARYGDGELEMLHYKNIGFQTFNKKLSDKLVEVLNDVEKNKNCLVCMPDGFFNTKNFKSGPSLFWFFHKAFFFHKYNNLLSRTYTFGNTSVTRPYNDYKSKLNAPHAFNKFRRLLSGLRVLIVEGAGTKLGVGNDLLNTSACILRITTLNKNAFDLYDEIYDSIIEHKNMYDIVLISLGPTATILSFDLSKAGIRCIDTGHIDIEYEWMLSNASSKTAVAGKNVNEVGAVSSDGNHLNDDEYTSQIIQHIS